MASVSLMPKSIISVADTTCEYELKRFFVVEDIRLDNLDRIFFNLLMIRYHQPSKVNRACFQENSKAFPGFCLILFDGSDRADITKQIYD